jgi:diadenosine tetraphosphate (Ap4A) HIT family hydrolase
MHHYRKTRKSYTRLRTADNQHGNCPFCSDEKLSEKIVDSNTTMDVIPNRTRYDMFEGLPVNDHFMVIPKRHLETIDDFTSEEKLDMMNMVGKYEKQGYSVYARGVGSINRSVKHQHTHLMKLRNKGSKFIFFMRKPYILIHK